MRAARILSGDPATWAIVACMAILIGLLWVISNQHTHMDSRVGDVQHAVEQLKASQAVLKVENQASIADRSRLKVEARQIKEETTQIKEAVKQLESEVQK
jgi:hypothetical protein